MRRDVVFWVVVLGGIAVLLHLLGDVLPPFVLGMAIAYVVDPLVVALDRRGLSRAAAAGLLVGIAFAIGTAGLVLLVPVIVEQVMALAARVPDLVATAYAAALPTLTRTLALLGVGARTDLPQVLLGLAQRGEALLAAWATGLLGRGLALVNFVALLSVTPLVAFYLLRDWPRILAQIDAALPRDHAATIRAQAREADRVLAGYARGAALVCALLMAFYAVALSLVGLDFGLTIGLVAGALSFVPYLGALVGLASGVGVALWQFWPSWGRVLAVAAIFLVGQLTSDYVITPRVVGDRIGVHPLWVLFGFFAGGALFGFTGMLLSVPACAVLGVVARFGIARYKASTIYRGTQG